MRELEKAVDHSGCLFEMVAFLAECRSNPSSELQ